MSQHPVEIGLKPRQRLAEPEARERLENLGALQDWRRRSADLYGAIRRLPAEAGWRLWREQRDILFASHRQSPLAAARRARFFRHPGL